MGRSDRITERQLTVLAFICLLSPMIRILPSAAVSLGGKAVWLSAIVAWIVGKLFLSIIRALNKNAPAGDGLAGMLLKGLGGVGGRVFCIFCALWLTFYAGFVVRSAAERLLATVYPNGSSSIFVIVTLIVSVITALGLTKTLSRTAEILMPIIVAVIAVVLLSAVPEVSFENLLPVTFRDTKNIFLGAIPIFDVLTGIMYFLFLRGYVVKPAGQRPNKFPWFTSLVIVAFAITVVTIGTLGENLSISMENAFFMVVRNIKIFGVVERIESVVVAIWIVTDFIFTAALLMIIAEIWRTIFGTQKRQIFVFPTAAASGASAFLIAEDAFTLLQWSDMLIPLANIVVTVVIIPVALTVGKLRKKW